MVHGAVENGRIFYSPSGRGLAPFLARHGFDCWVLDLRGRGDSRPHVDRDARWGQTEELIEDLPRAIAEIAERRGRPPELWIAHSWGGVLVASFFARFPNHAAHVHAAAFFGVKRRVCVRNLARRIQVDLVWKLAGRIVTGAVGYLPARRLGWGSDDESRGTWRDCVTWVREPSPWIDPSDGFDYAAAAATRPLPPTLWITGAADRCLGHRGDARLFMAECHQPDADELYLARSSGFSRDSGHIDMLTHPDADTEHFPMVAKWLTARL